MAKEQSLGITIKKEDNFPEWYNQVVVKADLADFSPVQGCMIIKPVGMGMWEQMQVAWNQIIRKLGVKNMYFPLLIPESFFKKEEDHVEGFKAEVAWIEQKEGEEEKYALRPTSETIIGDYFAKAIRSHRDLPLKINQWANIMRWETTATRPFLRNREFLWHEGHCAFRTQEEATNDALEMIEQYALFCENYLAIPMLYGKKAESEKFAGAETTYTIEGMAPDGKAIQAGTTHDLSDHFAKVFDITYMADDNKSHHAFTTSWGWSTRLIGAMIAAHGDNKGMVVPPRVAPDQVVIVPIGKDKEKIDGAVQLITDQLQTIRYDIDTNTHKSVGFRFAQAELKGTPIRIEVGPKDIDQHQCVLVRRDTGEKYTVPLHDVGSEVIELLETIHHDMLKKAKHSFDNVIVDVSSMDEFKKKIEEGFMVKCFVCGEDDIDKQIKDETAATPRVIPLDQPDMDGKTCIKSGKPAKYACYYARSY